MIFPPCKFGGRVIREKRYCRMRSPARTVRFDLCSSCHLAGPIETELIPICDDAADDMACIYRGEQVRTATRKLQCCANIEVPVFACQKHGECSIEKRFDGIRACDGCSDRKTAETLPPLHGDASLVWFVWPRRETREVWEQQQEVIRRSIAEFDGLKLCWIASDTSSDDAAIDRSIWDEVFVGQNDPAQREAAGWRHLMECMAGRPGFTVWLHAKGAWRGTPELHLKRWWEIGYDTLLDVHSVRRALKHNIIAGVFRRNCFAANLGVRWHFSGAFYAVRNSHIRFPDSKSGGWYAEAWPALIAPQELAACLAFDGCRDLYQAQNWKEVPCR